MSPKDRHEAHHPLRLVLDEEKIQSSSIEKAELIDVYYGDESYGPIWAKHFKAHIDVFPDLKKQIKIKDHNSKNEWQQIFDHHLFQRRGAPELPDVPDAEVGQIFFLLKNGHKVGPLTSDVVEKKLKNLEVLMTDPISTDMGKSWAKVYQIKQFDRRFSEVSTQSDIAKKYEDIQEGLTGAQILSTLSKESEIPLSPVPTQAEDSEEESPTIEEHFDANDSQSFDWKQTKWFALFVVAFIGIITVLSVWDTPTNQSKRSPASVNKSVKKKSVKKYTPKTRKVQKQAKTQKRNQPKVQNKRRARARTQKPVEKSRAFRSLNKERNGRRSPASYDEDDGHDDSDPYEQDEVRDQVSKETMDPYEREEEFERQRRRDERRDLDSGPRAESDDPDSHENDDESLGNPEGDVYYSPTPKKK
ncbi:MAG: hypothetical protein ACPGJV_01870 [Bacteriovoracaceae bacterium]